MAGAGLDLKYLGGFWLARVMADNEFLCVDRWLNDTLKGDATLVALLPDGAGGVFGEDIPEGTGRPFVSFAFYRAERDDGNGWSIEANLVYRIGAFGQLNNYAALAPIVGRIKTLINVGHVTRSDGEIASCTRVMPTREPFSKDY